MIEVIHTASSVPVSAPVEENRKVVVTETVEREERIRKGRRSRHTVSSLKAAVSDMTPVVVGRRVASRVLAMPPEKAEQAVRGVLFGDEGDTGGAYGRGGGNLFKFMAEFLSETVESNQSQMLAGAQAIQAQNSNLEILKESLQGCTDPDSMDPTSKEAYDSSNNTASKLSLAMEIVGGVLGGLAILAGVGYALGALGTLSEAVCPTVMSIGSKVAIGSVSLGATGELGMFGVQQNASSNALQTQTQFEQKVTTFVQSSSNQDNNEVTQIQSMQIQSASTANQAAASEISSAIQNMANVMSISNNKG